MTAYVIDNHPIMAEQIAMVIRRIKPGLKVVAVRTINDLDFAVQSSGPAEIICTDLGLPVSFGISSMKTLRKKFPNTRLAVITSSDPKPYETECLNCFYSKNRPCQPCLRQVAGAIGEFGRGARA